ncbi:MAG: hypothetical protein LBV30_10885 [Propionibacteriaceae bacterium]|jgi:hypothetical protein|nr:hypothetical protein [Propionibacteriaceae bacterium]
MRISERPLIARLALVVCLVLPLTACTTGVPATKQDIKSALDQALDQPFELRKASLDHHWSVTSDGIDFSCQSTRIDDSPIPAYHWSTSCDFAVAWLQGHATELQQALGRWLIRDEASPSATPGVSTDNSSDLLIATSKWSQIRPLSEALARVINDLVIPLDVPSASDDQLTVAFPLPKICWNIGENSAENSSNLYCDRYFYFRTASVPPVEAVAIKEAMEADYAREVAAGQWFDTTVPAAVVAANQPTHDSDTINLWFESRSWVSLKAGADGQHCLSAIPISQEASGEPGVSSWGTMAEELGGEVTFSEDESSYSVSWTLGPHRWLISETKVPVAESTDGRQDYTEERAATAQTAPITASMDGQPLTLSPQPWRNNEGAPIAGYWCYPVSDIEQLFGVTITPVDNNPALGAVTLNG